MENEELKELFGTEALTFDKFVEKLQGAGTEKINLVNIAKGGYIDAGKHAREVEAARKAAVMTSKEYVDLSAERDSYKQQYEGVLAENKKKENAGKVSAKVAPDFVDFIYDKVAKELEKDGKATFEQKLDEVLKTSPQYKKSGEQNPIIRLSSGLKQEGGERQGESGSINQSMNNAILAAAGRTAKA